MSTKLQSVFDIYPVIITHTQFVQMLVSLLVLIGYGIILRYTRFGILTRAMRDDFNLFQTLGVNAKRFRILLFAASGLLAGIGGLLYTSNSGVEPYSGLPLFLMSVTALIIGGDGNFETPVIGALLLGILQALLLLLTSSQWQNTLTFAILILFLIFRPQGLLGEKGRTV